MPEERQQLQVQFMEICMLINSPEFQTLDSGTQSEYKNQRRRMQSQLKPLDTQASINNTPSEDRGNYSDGFHTFNELYEFRKVYNAALFNEWGRFDIPQYDVHKSLRHYDGELCFGGGWFIVVAVLPTGQISNHYELKDWDLFKIPSVERAKYPFDGHTGKDVMDRLLGLQYLPV